MTQSKPEPTKLHPMGLESSLNDALRHASWITSSDVAAITLARRLAVMLDVCFDTGSDVKDVPQLVGKYLAVLQQLQLTTASRVATKQGEETDGTDYVGDYLRLIDSKNKQQTARPAKRGSSGGATS